MLEALDAVADAIQDAIDDGSIDLPSLRIVKTLRPQKVLEHIEPGWTCLVYPASVESTPTSKPWDEYQVTIAHELATECTATAGDEHTQERIVAEKLQSITDEIRKRISVSSGFNARPVAGMLDESAANELAIISAAMANTFRIIHNVE